MKNLKYTWIAFLLLLGVGGCEEERIIYDGPTVVEFAPATASVKKGMEAAPGTFTAKVQLVGPQQPSDIILDYVVDPSGTATADQYLIEGTAGKVVIPAKSSHGFIKIAAVPSKIPQGSKTVVLILKGNPAIAPSANYKKFTLTITQ